GKSTLIKLMLGFYIPQRGKLCLSGKPVEEVDNSDWLRHCGVVMQSGQIFTSSILENISLSEEKPDSERAMEILETVGLRKFVEILPMGIHTRLGVSGIELSGGQKQRL
ncbi:MAG TPA: ABC transporter ATP-binding protein, partial [Porphyromonadaceae bacterium]|nr:ABC transporter ATP-binding protein [Porphyromonadaceae bacterium]